MVMTIDCTVRKGPTVPDRTGIASLLILTLVVCLGALKGSSAPVEADGEMPDFAGAGHVTFYIPDNKQERFALPVHPPHDRDLAVTLDGQVEGPNGAGEILVRWSMENASSEPVTCVTTLVSTRADRKTHSLELLLEESATLGAFAYVRWYQPPLLTVIPPHSRIQGTVTTQLSLSQPCSPGIALESPGWTVRLVVGWGPGARTRDSFGGCTATKFLSWQRQVVSTVLPFVVRSRR